MASHCLWDEVQIPLDNKRLPISLVLWAHFLLLELCLSDTLTCGQFQTQRSHTFSLSLSGISLPLPVLTNAWSSTKLSRSTTASRRPSRTFSLCAVFLGGCISLYNTCHIDWKLFAYMFNYLTRRSLSSERMSYSFSHSERTMPGMCRCSVHDCGIELNNNNKSSSCESLIENLGEIIPWALTSLKLTYFAYLFHLFFTAVWRNWSTCYSPGTPCTFIPSCHALVRGVIPAWQARLLVYLGVIVYLYVWRCARLLSSPV